LSAGQDPATHVVIIPKNHQGDRHWADFCYRLPQLNKQEGPILLYKQQLTGDRLEDCPEEEPTLLLQWKPLGYLTRVFTLPDSVVSLEEQARLEGFYQGNHTKPTTDHCIRVPRSTVKGNITHYVDVHQKPSQEVYPPSVGEGTIQARVPVWSGLNTMGQVAFDWGSMIAKVEVQHQLLLVARSGKWVYFRTEEPEAGVPLAGGALTLKKHKRVKAQYTNIGELDMRVGCGVLALAEPPPHWSVLDAFLAPPVQKGQVQKPKHLHWLFIEHIRSLIKATQFVGAPPTACAF